MSWKLMVGFALPWALMAMLGTISTVAATPEVGSSGDAFNAFVSTTSNPTTISIDEPNVEGEGGLWDQISGTIGGFVSDLVGGVSERFEFAKQGAQWLAFMGNAAILNYDFLTVGWIQSLRYLMLAMAAPLMYMAAKESAQLLSGFLGGVSRVFGR